MLLDFVMVVERACSGGRCSGCRGFLLVFSDCLPEQGPNQAGLAFRLLQQMEQLWILIAVDFQNDLDHIFFLPGGFAGMVCY